MWDKLNKQKPPTLYDINQYVNNEVWENLYANIVRKYNVKPTFEYSGCVMPGWNIKFKKSGKNLCTVYPYENYVTVLVVIGAREKQSFEALLPSLHPHIKEVVANSQEGMGQLWLFIPLEDKEILADLERCIDLRAVKKVG